MISRKLRICRLRSSTIDGSSEGPSTPQFQLKFSFAPSRILFAVGLVVLAFVGHQVGQRVAVVSGHEVDRMRGRTP